MIKKCFECGNVNIQCEYDPDNGIPFREVYRCEEEKFEETRDPEKVKARGKKNDKCFIERKVIEL